MLRKTMLAGAALMLLATPALAHHCPKDAAAIEAGLAKAAKLTDAQKADITALKDKGMAAHNSGDHAAAEATLAEAMRMLLNEM